jgi:Tfp pilus assembly protein PilF
MLGLVYVSIDSLDQARLALSRAVGIDPAHSEARATLARLAGRR